TSGMPPSDPPKPCAVSACGVSHRPPGSWKPPFFSLPNAPTPTTPNPTTASIAATSTSRPRRTTKLPIAPVILRRPCPLPRRAGPWLLAWSCHAPLAADPLGSGAQPGPVGPALRGTVRIPAAVGRHPKVPAGWNVAARRSVTRRCYRARPGAAAPGAVSGNQAELPGPRGGLGPVGGAELAQDVGHVLFDGVERHEQVAGDALV